MIASLSPARMQQWRKSKNIATIHISVTEFGSYVHCCNLCLASLYLNILCTESRRYGGWEGASTCGRAFRLRCDTGWRPNVAINLKPGALDSAVCKHIYIYIYIYYLAALNPRQDLVPVLSIPAQFPFGAGSSKGS